mmetsp:Transcript_10253/g.23227  ORF Transcript_10253/g.23227 Transcript_10253/m.23227 type:complete len:200 (-) Transcript_10253:62-661(-)
MPLLWLNKSNARKHTSSRSHNVQASLSEVSASRSLASRASDLADPCNSSAFFEHAGSDARNCALARPTPMNSDHPMQPEPSRSTAAKYCFSSTAKCFSILWPEATESKALRVTPPPLAVETDLPHSNCNIWKSLRIWSRSLSSASRAAATSANLRIVAAEANTATASMTKLKHEGTTLKVVPVDVNHLCCKTLCTEGRS